MRQAIQAWTRPSSRGSTNYEITLWDDGSTSCDCPGWVYAKRGRPRSCKHITALAAPIRAALDRHQRGQGPPTVETPEPVSRQDWPYQRPSPAPPPARPAPATPPRRRIRLTDEET